MNTDNLIKKLKVMLGAETEEVVAVVEAKEAQFIETTLVDGTIVSVEGELEAGKALSVVTEEGPVEAPTGIHETTEGLLITVGEAGIIESIEEKEAEAEVVEAQEEEKVEVEMEAEEAIVEETTEEQDHSDLLSSIAELITPFTEEIENLKTQVVTLSERFEAISDEPATTPIKRTFSDEAKIARNAAESKFERLVAMRNKK